MIHYTTGDILFSNADALVNTVNTVGVMGKGLALQFKKLFPANFKAYQNACKTGVLQIGKPLVFEEESLLNGKKIIINIPTKTDWRLPSQYSYVESGLEALKEIIHARNLKTVAIPPLGAGNGKLDWVKVKTIIEEKLSDVKADIYVFEPGGEPSSVIDTTKKALTPARAMLLAVLYDLVRNGEFVSEFSVQKVTYFLQRFGAENEFRLDFQPYHYGPYSSKIRHLLYQLNGFYIAGFESKDKKPFDMLSLQTEHRPIVNAFLEKPENSKFLGITQKTKAFLAGFYSDFSLELLSTIDFIISENKGIDEAGIKEKLQHWNQRKTRFSNDQYIQLALNQLNTHLRG